MPAHSRRKIANPPVMRSFVTANAASDEMRMATALAGDRVGDAVEVRGEELRPLEHVPDVPGERETLRQRPVGARAVVARLLG